MKDKGFPPEVTDYSGFIKAMQWKREKVDYTYACNPNIATIFSDIVLARTMMANYLNCPEIHRRAFAVYLLFKDDRHEKKEINV